MKLLLIVLGSFVLGGCIQTRQQTVAANCAAATFPDDPFIAASFTDKFTGRFWSGERYLDVAREGRRMFVRRPETGQRQLRRVGDIPGEGSFRDGCDTRYEFTLPPDGPGGYVTITDPDGGRSEWHRRVA